MTAPVADDNPYAVAPADFVRDRDAVVDVWRASDDEALAAAHQLCATEGILPALESSHALAMLPRLAREGARVVLLGLSGRGDKDLATYQSRLEV